jgi:hypothetical protein
MDDKSKQTLMLILGKGIQELTADDIAFMKARRRYLNSEQLKRYESVLEVEVKESPLNKLEKMNKAELIKLGKKLGVDTNVGKDELISNIMVAMEAQEDEE